MCKPLSHLLTCALIFLLVAAPACDKRGDVELDTELAFEGKLLFVEDLRGRSGLLAGDFGDLVVLDGDRQARRVLTDGPYYNAHPSWSEDRTGILFESKRLARDGSPSISGLTASSHLFVLDVQTGDVRHFSKDFEERFGEAGRAFHKPAWHMPSNRVATLEHRLDVPRDISFTLSIFDLSSGSVQRDAADGVCDLNTIEDIYWSPDGRWLVTACSPRDKSVAAHVVVYDTEAAAWAIITDNGGEDRSHSGPGTIVCRAGNWAPDGKQFMYSCKDTHGTANTFYVHDLESGEHQRVWVLEEEDEQGRPRAVRSLQWSPVQEKIAFIASDPDIERDLWLYDLSGKKLVQLTADGHERRWLRWYE